MPSMESPFKADSVISAGFLREEISSGSPPLVLDCRSQEEYSNLHVQGAINITVPVSSLMFRRLQKGNLRVQCLIQCNKAKEKFAKFSKSHPIVLYDENTNDVNVNSSSVIGLLMKKLNDDGCQASCLQGGFSSFHEKFPEYCMADEEMEKSLHDTIMELSNLNFSSDSDNQQGSTSPLPTTPTDLYPIEVIPYLFLGNAKSSANSDILKKLGIKYILNVTSQVPNVFEQDNHFKYMQIPIRDHWSQNLSKFFPQAIQFIDEARQRKCGVLVHCLAGISRSVTVTVAYLMQKKQMSLNDAYDFVKKCKPNISPNFNFMGQLLDFEKMLQSPQGCNMSDSDCDSGRCPGRTFFMTPTKNVSPHYIS